MSRTIRHNEVGGIDGASRHKSHRNFKNHERDWIQESLQNNLINTRQSGKEHITHLGFNTPTRMNHSKAGSSWRRPQSVFTLHPTPKPSTVKVGCGCGRENEGDE